jgi:hypothetical protein
MVALVTCSACLAHKHEQCIERFKDRTKPTEPREIVFGGQKCICYCPQQQAHLSRELTIRMGITQEELDHFTESLSEELER